MAEIKATVKEYTIKAKIIQQVIQVKVPLTSQGSIGPQGPDGQQGEQGEQGEPGVGVPAGGAAEQVLEKVSNADYDTRWATRPADKSYTKSFTAASIVNVPHNLNKYPSIIILDSAGDQVEADIDHVSINELNLYFSSPFTGVVTCN